MQISILKEKFPILPYLEKSILWQKICRLLMRPEYQLIIGTLILMALVLVPIVMTRVQDYPYSNKTIGYDLVVPKGWGLKVQKQGSVVILQQKSGEEFIKVYLEAFQGNPYGNSPLDFIERGILPQAQYDLAERQGKAFQLRVASFSRSLNNREWGTATFLVGYDDLYAAYATMVGDYMLVVMLEAPKGVDQVYAEKSFYKILNFIKINPQARKNVFLEQNVDHLFSSETGAGQR